MNAVSVAARAALATILLFSLVTVSFAGAPALPCEFYGTVTIDGQPAPAGTIVVAKINDMERGQYVLEEAGVYGGPGTFDKRLKVVAEEGDLSGTALITFWIDGQKAWQETDFQSGISMNLDLSVGGAQPTPVVVPASSVQEPADGEASSGDASVPEISAVEQIAVSDEPSVSDALDAGFSASPVAGTVPFIVQFTDLSTGGPIMWAWDFGDGSTDLVASPAHEYTTAGIYTVSLTVSNETSSDTETREGFIDATGNAGLKAAFTADPQSGEAPLTVTFTDQSTGSPTSWAWDFGDGTGDSSQNAYHVYQLPGLYTVSLTVSDGIASDTVKKEQYISVLTPGQIIADFSATPLSGTAPLSITFTDASTGEPTLWAWDFGDGSGDLVQNPVHVYTEGGTYTVSMTASNDVGDISSKVREKYITVAGEVPPTPSLTPIAIPAIPETFYGTVLMYGTPIRSGGKVEARVAGYDLTSDFNPIKTAKLNFGTGGSFSPKLQVQGVPADSEIEFWVSDAQNRLTRAYIRNDDGTYSWSILYEPGKDREVHLELLKTPPITIDPIPVSTPAPSPCPGVPSLPMTIEGSVHITTGDEYIDEYGSCKHCEPNLKENGVIEARIEGYDVSGPSNPIVVNSSSGYFGGGNSSWADKLSVQGRCITGDVNMTFWVKDGGWQQYTQAWVVENKTYTHEIPFSPGSSATVDLWVGPEPMPIMTPTPTPTPATWQPHQFYGHAEFNGYPLREGDRVMATTEGVDLTSPTNPISVYQFGEYGDPVGKDLLMVDVPYTAMNQSDPIIFWIKPQNYQYWYRAEVTSPLSSDSWHVNYPFTPGSITTLDLRSSDREDFIVSYDLTNQVKNVILPDDYSKW